MPSMKSKSIVSIKYILFSSPLEANIPKKNSMMPQTGKRKNIDALNPSLIEDAASAYNNPVFRANTMVLRHTLNKG